MAVRAIKAESIAVAMKSVREDSVEHLFQPYMSRALTGPYLTEGLPEIPSVAELDIHEPLHARLSFKDSPAEPIVIVGLDDDGQDIAFVVADSTAQPQQLQLTKGPFKYVPGDDALRAELTVPPAGQAPESKIEFFISRERNDVLHRPFGLRLGEATIGGRRYALALLRAPGFLTYTLPDDSQGLTLHQLMIDLDGDGVFLTSLYGQIEKLEDEAFWVNEPFLIDGQAYKLSHVSATGDQLVIVSGPQSLDHFRCELAGSRRTDSLGLGQIHRVFYIRDYYGVVAGCTGADSPRRRRGLRRSKRRFLA